MPVKVDISVDPRANAEVLRVLSRLSPKRNTAINRKALDIAALDVQRRATQTYIVRGRGRFAEPLPDRLSARTGTLARSIGIDILGDLATIGTNLIYGAAHEDPQSGQTPRPFLAPALEDASVKFDEIYAKVLNEELQRR